MHDIKRVHQKKNNEILSKGLLKSTKEKKTLWTNFLKFTRFRKAHFFKTLFRDTTENIEIPENFYIF